MRWAYCFASWVAILLTAGHSPAGAHDLAIASNVQFPKIVIGYINPINAYVYNFAPAGSDIGNYEVRAAYAPPHNGGYTNFDYYYLGTKIADGGTGFASMQFPLDTTGFDGGDVAVKVTFIDTDTGRSIQQGGQFTAVHHATPGMYINGQLVTLTSKNVIHFTTSTNILPPRSNDPTEIELGGSAVASSVGMQGRSPTSDLDLDYITSSGSAEITSTLAPFFDVPSDSDPNEGVPFNLTVEGTPGHYVKSFFLHYSDDNDLPGADAPGSDLTFFTVTVDLGPTVIDWTIETVPEPSPLLLTWIGATLVLCGRRRPPAAKCVRRHVSA